MTLRNSERGFTLIELMIVVAVIAVVASIALPRALAARVAANENAAIATLRAIASAQQQVQASAAVDTDADGSGEYCFLAELAGIANLRVFDSATFAPALGSERLEPPALPTTFGRIVADGAGDGCVLHQGYYFKVFLPDASDPATAPTGAFAEAAAGGTAAGDIGAWGSDAAETLWILYAWPVESGRTGRRVFFVNQDGDIVAFDNKSSVYSGPAGAPPFDAALSAGAAGDFDQPIGLASLGLAANDGNLWAPVGS